MTDITVWIPEGFKLVGGAEYLGPCYNPLCGRVKKFAWNHLKAKGWCMVCGARASSFPHLQKLYPNGESVSLSFGDAFSNPLCGYSPKPAFECPEAMEYLQGRGVSPHHVVRCGATFGDGRVWFPVWSPFGLAPFTVGRSIDPDNQLRWLSYPAEKGKYVFGQRVRDGPEPGPVVLVEGVMDVLTPRIWNSALCTLGSSPGIDLLVWIGKTFSKVGVWYDPGAGGSKGKQLVKNVLEGWFPNLPVIIVDGPEPGSTSPEVAAGCLTELETRYCSGRIRL